MFQGFIIFVRFIGKLSVGKLFIFSAPFCKSSYILLETSENFFIVSIEFVAINYPGNRIVLLDIKLNIATRAFGPNLDHCPPTDYMPLGTLES